MRTLKSLADRGGWTGGVGQLARVLNWDLTPRAASAKLRKMQPELEMHGIAVRATGGRTGPARLP